MIAGLVSSSLFGLSLNSFGLLSKVKTDVFVQNRNNAKLMGVKRRSIYRALADTHT